MTGKALSTILLAALALLVAAPTIAQPLTIEKQDSFFIGGHDVRSDTLSTLPAYAPSGTITVGQMYVRCQIPGGCPAAGGDLKPYLRIPILVLFGDYVDQAARWAPRLSQCRAFAEAMKKAGGKTEVVVLPEIGVKGNSHMLMQDRNSLEIAAWLVGWLNENVGARKN